MRKRILFLIVLILLIFIKLYAQSDLQGYYYNSSDSGITFSNDDIVVDTTLQRPESLPEGTSNYIQFQKNKISFLNINDEIQQEFLLLHNCPILLLYEGQSGRQLELWGNFSRVLYPEGFEYFASSTFQRGKEVYPVDNLRSLKLSEPWVEGVYGSGIGEWIEIRGKTTEYGNTVKISGILFSNGYVSYNKPYLYDYNSRVKIITIAEPNGNNPYTVELLDSPNPQHIILPEEYESIRLTIIDIYSGSQWQDTCINFLIPYGY